MFCHQLTLNLKILPKGARRQKQKKLTGDHYYFDLWKKSMKF